MDKGRRKEGVDKERARKMEKIDEQHKRQQGRERQGREKVKGGKERREGRCRL